MRERASDAWEFRIPASKRISACGLFFAVSCVVNGSASCASVQASRPPSVQPSAVNVNVSPTTASVLLGNQQTFTATVTNSDDKTVVWTINGIDGGGQTVGTITDAGIYTAPNIIIPSGAVQVTATSHADSTKTATARLAITSDITVSVVPIAATMKLGFVQAFQASVWSRGVPDTAVVWSTSGPACPSQCGSIDANGIFTAPLTLPQPPSLTVTATSVADPSKQMSVPVTVGTASAPQLPTYNVKTYGGAACDGVTDDTAAIQKTISDAGNAMSSAGGAGPIYFPRSTGACLVHALTWPTMLHQGWLVTIFDNALEADTLSLGGNNAYLGKTSSFLGDSGSFLVGPTAQWMQNKGFSGPLVDISGRDQVSLDGLDIQGRRSDSGPTMHVHDNLGVGSVFITIKNSTVGSESGYAFSADSSGPSVVAGFGLLIENSSFSSPLTPTMRFTNYGMVTIRGRFVSQGLSITNLGVPSDGDFLVDGVLSESLANSDFLTLFPTNGPITDITLRRVVMADSPNSWLIKQVSPNNQLSNVKIEMIPQGAMSNGLIDPGSSPALLSVFCEGYGCSDVLGQSQPALYLYFGFPPRSPALFYGSKYVHNPLQITWE